MTRPKTGPGEERSDDAGHESGQGLVPCSITSRFNETETDQTFNADEFRAAFGAKNFPRLADAELSAGLYGDVGEVDGHRFELTIGPGIVRLSFSDEAAKRLRDEADPDRQFHAAAPNRGEIHEWSAGSRRALAQKFGRLDFNPLFDDLTRLSGMVTLTLPGDWLTVAPTGRHFKRFLKRFASRYERAWGEVLTGVWKMEFQRRGAPHVHIFMAPPRGLSESRVSRFDGLTFPVWLSLAWAEIVDHPDPEERRRHELAGTGIDLSSGLKIADPQQMVAYLLGYVANKGSKEYQHIIPEEWRGEGEGPGRFWGVWNLEEATVAVDVSRSDAVTARRVMRRWAKAQYRARDRSGEMQFEPGTVRLTVSRTTEVINLRTGEIRTKHKRRRVHRRRELFRSHGGYLLLRDGPEFAAQLARAVRLTTS